MGLEMDVKKQSRSQASRNLDSGRVPDKIAVIVDATKELKATALSWCLMKLAQPGDHVTLLGILHRIENPMGYKTSATGSAFIGTNPKALDHEIGKKMDHFETNLRQLSDLYDRKGVFLDIRITAGAPLKVVALQEAENLKATWVILDRNLRRERNFYVQRLCCNLILMNRDNQGEKLSDIGGGPIERTQGTMVRMSTDSSVAYPEYASSVSDILYDYSTNEGRLNFDSSGSLISDAWQKSSSSFDCRIPSPKMEQSPTHVASIASVGASNPDMCQIQTSKTERLESPATQQNSILRDVSEITLDGDADADIHKRYLKQASSPSGSDSYASTEDSPQSLIERENSFIDLHLISSPQGITTVWSSGDASPASVHSPNCERFEHGTVVMATKSLLLPQSCRKSLSTVSQGLPHPASTSPLRSATSALPILPSQSNSMPISVQPRRTFSVQVFHELFKELDPLGNRMQDLQDQEDQSIHKKSYQIQIADEPNPKLLLEKSVLTDKTMSSIPYFIDSSITLAGCQPKNHDGRESFQAQNNEKLSPPKHDCGSKLRKGLSEPPPLCSICKHKSPEFGKPPRIFMLNELKDATQNFSQERFIAEGGFGFVYKGVLNDGQVVAIKKLKASSDPGDTQFGAEVEVLSCAQHRNLVTLVGYCVENNQHALVYEYVCNGSLDQHLSKRAPRILDWPARQKIAIGAARGLRYLHEECRVGCIVHRDMRPNNILLTHDFTAMVGDFGLARLQPSGEPPVETQVIGSLGFVAPEYAESGQVTDKTDVYAFGVVLLELITGRKAIDFSQPKGEHSLTEWARPRLKNPSYQELLDPRIKDSSHPFELYWMVYAASLCIRKDPSMRPSMSQILRILEGDPEDVRSMPSISQHPLTYDLKHDIQMPIKSVSEIEEVHDSGHLQQPNNMMQQHGIDGSLRNKGSATRWLGIRMSRK